jgi:hypothetical protein
MATSVFTRIGLGLGLIGATITSILIVFSILRSTSSTAAIGFVFIPVYFVMSFVAFFIWGYSLGYIQTWLASAKRIFDFKIISAFLVGICFAVLLFGGLGKGLLLTSAVSQIHDMNTKEELLHTFEHSSFKSNKFVLGAIAQHRAASTELLDRIAKLSDRSLHDSMGSLFPVLGDNRKGLAVMRLVIKNPNVSANTIQYLADTSQVDYVLGDIAGNSKISIETSRRLEIKKDYLIDWGLAQNPNTPPDVFSKLLDREKHFTQRTTLEMLIRNPSTPAEIRTKASELLTKY